MKFRSSLIVATLGLAATLAAAQSPKKVRGTLVAVNDAGLVVHDGQGEQTVPTTATTAYRLADATAKRFAPVARGELKPGLFVSVTFETDSATGAKNVWVAADEATLTASFATAARPAASPAAAAGADAVPATLPANAGDTTVGRVKSGKMARRFMELHDQYVARAKQGDIDVVFLGDSITQGWQKAPDLWKSRYEPLKAVNFGISGDVMQHVLWRIENGELDGISPKVIVLMVGTNNSNRRDSEPIVRGIKHMIGVIHSKCPTSKVLLVSILPRQKDTDTNQSRIIAEVNPELAKLDDGKLTHFLDVTKHFKDADGKLRYELFSDALHPNPAGYQVWADAMQPKLEELLKQ